jgi:iron complex outermembrane receptor protein
VVDKTTGQPIPGVNVNIQGFKMVSTDYEGDQLNNVKTGDKIVYSL